MNYTVSKTVINGIERITYMPKTRHFKTPIVMQHGMWQRAQCWQEWQKLFAEWGWETHAYSLPGHGDSPAQRPIRWCTLGYYLDFLKVEIARLAAPPILMGHSMGGALIQWYLKKVGDLPVAVLVASATSHDMIMQVLRTLFVDPVGFVLSVLNLTTTPMVRTPRRAAKILLSDTAMVTPEELHALLGPDSMWVLMQYNPLLWSPRKDVKIPMLWLAGAKDVLIPEAKGRRSAAFYGADYIVVEEAGHNIMMERNSHTTAETIHNWLVYQGIE